MGVAKLHYLIAIESFGQVVEGEFDMSYSQLVGADICAIEEHQPQEE